MIKITVNNEMFAYDMYHITKAFCPGETIEQEVNKKCPQTIQILLEGDYSKKEHFVLEEKEINHIEDRKLKKRYVNQAVYNWLVKITGKDLAWGIMTGVRPTKPMMNLMESGLSDDEIITWMQDNYCVTDEKAQLGLKVAKKEKALLDQLDYKDGYSLYIGIPFCPSTCSYCSFTSYPISGWKQRVDKYLDAVCKELTFIASVSQKKKLNTVYVGGGTPTTLEPEQLDRLLTHLEIHFSYEQLKEITVETTWA